MNPTSSAATHIHISGGYDAGNTEAKDLPPIRQITGSWTVAAAPPGAIRTACHKALGTRELCVVLTSHTYALPGETETVNNS